LSIFADLGDVPILHRTKKRILKELQNGKLHGYGLARRLNLPLTGIYQHLKDLSEERLIVSEKKGRRAVYSLTKKGELLLQILENST
jgi:DNA-binding PadR family transcriptional regulator